MGDKLVINELAKLRLFSSSILQPAFSQLLSSTGSGRGTR